MNETLQKPNVLGANWLNVILGGWVIISPFILGFSNQTAVMWNCVATGGAIFLLALIRSRKFAPSMLNMFLGIWLIFSPFALRVLRPAVRWNCIILGIIITIAALAARNRRVQFIVTSHSPNR
ncbi:MAG TPA: SPW repeat protein [Candidatus Angelobacter sp.]|nr:SPW repeat protein [Candidatus Angelobacter sp.]